MALKGRSNIARVGLVGTGTIGSDWAVRCLANGLDVSVADPAPGAEERLRAHIARIWPLMEEIGLKDGASPDRLTFWPSIAEAVANADFIQENVPERIELKIAVFDEISRNAPADTVIASSSSGLLPSEIQSQTRHPERVVIGHPFTPLYIIPLVEVVGGEQTSDEAKAKAGGFYQGIGMRPLLVRKEIDAFISDRLQTALWREALHLLNDDVATIAEIDAALWAGPGLRWAFMGVATAWHISGERGMRESMGHFGHTIKLPWTKLEAPPFSEELVEKIASGCEAVQGDRDRHELHRRRDRTLLAILDAIEKNWYGPGEDGWPEMDTKD